MTRKQQGIVLFLSLSLILFFALAESLSPGRSFFPQAPGRIPLAEGPGQRTRLEADEAAHHRGSNRFQGRSNIPETVEKKEGMAAERHWATEDLSRQIVIDSRIRPEATLNGKREGDTEVLGPIQKQILSIPININTAPLEELDALPGIGPHTAQAIIDFRGRFGPFQSLEDLMKVRGIGPKKLATLRPHIILQ